MKSIADLYKNEPLKERVAQSFIPYSADLTKAWQNLTGHKVSGDSQKAWGNLCAQAVLLLDEYYIKNHSGPGKPRATVEKLYFFAATLRMQIEQHLRGNSNYATSRICPKPGVGNSAYVLYTMISDKTRYADLVNAGMNAITHLSNQQDCKYDEHYFFMHGHPDNILHDTSTAVSFARQKEILGLHTTPQDKRMLLVESFQHVVTDDTSATKNKELLKFTCVRKYQWLDLHSKNKMISHYFDISNPFGHMLPKLFSYVEKQSVRAWENPLSDTYSKTKFFQELGELMWYLPQMSPLVNGSAATSAIVMTWCLLRQLGEEAPLFFEPGLSADILAMLSTRENFKQNFEKRLRLNHPTPEEIKTAYHEMPLSNETSQRIVSQAYEQVRRRHVKEDIQEDFRNTELFQIIFGKTFVATRKSELEELYAVKKLLSTKRINPKIMDALTVYEQKFPTMTHIECALEWARFLNTFTQSIASSNACRQ